MPYFRMVETTLSSAMKRFTVLFEMGRSGTASLLSPSNSFLLFVFSLYTSSLRFLCTTCTRRNYASRLKAKSFQQVLLDFMDLERVLFALTRLNVAGYCDVELTI